MPLAAPALAMLLAIAPPEAPPSEAPPPETLQTTADLYDRMTVPVSIGAEGPFRFLVDTGAQTTILSQQTATRLGLEPINHARILGVAGTREVPVVNVSSLRMGRRTWRSKGVPLLTQQDMGADGIVGLDGLQGQRIVINFQTDEITLAHAASPDADNNAFDIVVTARRQRGELILTDAIADGIKVDVVIDTGSDITVANRALQQALARTSPTTLSNLHSVTGQDIPADIGLLREFHVDRIRIANVQVAYTDSPTFRVLKLNRRPALLLGMQALRLFPRIAIDFARKQVLFNVPPGF